MEECVNTYGAKRDALPPGTAARSHTDGSGGTGETGIVVVGAGSITVGTGCALAPSAEAIEPSGGEALGSSEIDCVATSPPQALVSTLRPTARRCRIRRCFCSRSRVRRPIAARSISHDSPARATRESSARPSGAFCVPEFSPTKGKEYSSASFRARACPRFRRLGRRHPGRIRKPPWQRTACRSVVV